MIKKLDKLIIKAFTGPFVMVFFLTLMVLLLQYFWLWVDEFVGKGLSTIIILEFIWYQIVVLVPLALPLAVLLSSLMTFGNLGESMELVAIKSSGISLLRFMQPIFVVSIFLCGIAFLFSNNIVPVAILKSQTLLADIVWAKPSFDIKEGEFYDKIDGFSIKVGIKETDSIVHDVIIYERGYNNFMQDNFTVAKSGVMRTTTDKRFMEFHLKDGWRYQERGTQLSTNTEFIRIKFDDYIKQFDLSTFGMRTRTSDSVNKDNFRMQSMRQLNHAIDSLEKGITDYSKKVKQDVFSTFAFTNYLDSSSKKQTGLKLDSIKKFDQLIPDSAISTVNQQAVLRINSITLNAEVAASEFVSKQKELRMHKIEWHKKITYSVACLVLFLIGAPLGAIIRKGGIGSSLVFAVVFFMIFYFLNTTGEKYARENILSPVAGVWLSTLFLTPIGIFLTYKAMHDSQLFNKEFYFRFTRKMKLFFQSKNK